VNGIAIFSFTYSRMSLIATQLSVGDFFFFACICLLEVEITPSTVSGVQKDEKKME
jgi:hypothetical protein